MNTFKQTLCAFALVLALVLAVPVSGNAQATLSSTTLNGAIGGPSTGATGAARYPQTIPLTAVTNITAPGQPTSTSEIGTPGGNPSFTILCVDKECMQVLSVNTTAKTVFVNRGYLGTGATAHIDGATVWFGPPEYFGNNGFFNPLGPTGACLSSALRVLPQFVPETGQSYTCVPTTSGATTGIWASTATDGYFFVPPSACSSAVATTAYTAGYPIMTSAASGNPVLAISTTSTAGTLEVTCPINVPTQLAAGKGVTLNAASLLYGVQTTNLASIAAATINKVVYPVSTAAGVAAAGTVTTTAAGTLTATPTSLQLTTTTTGTCFDEKVSFGTPIQAVGDVTQYTLDQVFTTAGSTATIVQICGVMVYYSLNKQ